MAAVVDRGGYAAASEPPANPARSVEAAKLLDMFSAAKPINPDAFVPEVGMPGGGDIQLQPGLFTYALIGPDVWPTDGRGMAIVAVLSARSGCDSTVGGKVAWAELSA